MRSSKIQMEINPNIGIEESNQRVQLNMTKIDTRLDGYSVLITAELDVAKKADMYLSRSVLHLQKAHALELQSEQDGKGESSKDEQRKHLDLAQEDALSYLRSPIITPSGKAYAFYLIGLVFTEKTLKAQAADYFEQSLETGGEGQYSAAIVFYLADYLESADQAEKAIKVYQKYFDYLSPLEKSMARYKMAWSYITLRKMKRAEEIFISLTKDTNNPEVSKASIRDLAFVASEIRDERGLIKLANSLFISSDASRLEFMSAAYSSLQRSRPGREFSVLFGELLKIAGRPEKRIALWISELKSMRQPFASKDAYGAFQALEREFSSASSQDKMSLLKEAKDDIEVEVSYLIRSYIDTYSMKENNSEKLSKKEMSTSLISLFRFFDTHFKKSTKRTAMYQVWFDVCNAEANYNCLIEVSNNVLKDKGLKKFSKRAEVEKIIALNALSKSVDKSNQNELVGNLEKYVNNRNNDRWIEFADLLANLYVSEKKIAQALKILEEIYKIQPSETTFYRLQMARFKGARYNEIVQARPPAGAEGSARLRELNREASLKMAIGFKPESGDFAEYEENIGRFLSLNEDKNKEALVLSDYLNAMIKRKEHVKAIEKISTLESATRGSSELMPIVDELMQFSLARARFDWINKILPSTEFNTTQRINYLSVVSRLVIEKVFDRPRFSKLKSDQKNYLFQNLALVSPDLVVDYLVQFGEAESPQLRLAGILAFQVKENSTSPVVSQSMRRALADQMPASWLSAPLTEVEKIAINVGKKKLKGKSTNVAAQIKTEISEVRKTRHLASRDLKNKDLTTRIRILETLQTAELRVAENVLRSPLPQGLSNADKGEYLKGLDKVAVEFREQAQQYALVLQQDRHAQEQDKSVSRAPSSEMAKQIPLPKTKSTGRIVQIVKTQGILAGLVYLDVLKETQKMTKLEYFQIKSALVLRLPANAGRYSFIKSLLRQENIVELYGLLGEKK